jgi:surfactin synthase thioesterase subunit
MVDLIPLVCLPFADAAFFCPWNEKAGTEIEIVAIRVREFAQYNAETMQDPEARKLVLPTLRADVEMHEEYVSGGLRGRRHQPSEGVSCAP